MISFMKDFFKKNRDIKDYKLEAKKVINSLNTLKMTSEQKGFCDYISGKINKGELIKKEQFELLKKYKKEIICLKDTKFKTSKEKEAQELKKLSKDCIYLLQKEREVVISKARELYSYKKDKFSQEDIDLLQSVDSIKHQDFLKLVKSSILKGVEMELNMNDFYFLYTQLEDLENNTIKNVIPFLEIRNRNISRI